MSGLVCLQGGGELRPPCRGIDEAVLSRAPVGPVVVLVGAAAVGRDHATAGAKARRWYASLAPGRDVVVAPDPREDSAGCRAALADAALVVLPGGSPDRLLAVLADDATGVGRLVVERWEAGAALSGASAGAMVLCETTFLPGAGRTAPGLGLVPGLAVPHFGGAFDRWSAAVEAASPVWGLPECGGILWRDGAATTAGHEPVGLRRDGTEASLAPGTVVVP